MAKKSLGQHWLNDRSILQTIIDAAEIEQSDTVLEIGPGMGSLTRHLVKQAGKVVAVEIDSRLIDRLAKEFKAENLQLVESDILQFDLSGLPGGYKVVANIPYYLTARLLRALSTSANPPSIIVLLIQKEVAERLAAKPGQMSLLAASVQLYYSVKLGPIVPAELFSPPPRVDSQVVILRRYTTPRFASIDDRKFFRLLKAGFSERRKKLRSSLSGGLAIDKPDIDKLLESAGIKPDVRAQELSLEEWHKLYLILEERASSSKVG